ncbi:hypothetical protein [Pedobacter psychroterrae]|uniref:Uncharacterized protein n=1 Tax=Pedobacter psychroterrae TaxID=2530453 RepID=A0A4R0NI66_9SPHI|nr:hypothetical protein [Pedobacter psychroterrae]TCD00311.1 hypothetical protein EZ437_13870 [Pedobacter psychroterrae]
MNLDIGDQKRSLAIKMTPFCKKVLRRFGLMKSQPLLFTSMSKKYNIVGSIRNADDIKLNEYKNVLDRKVYYLMKSIVYRGVEATEGLIRLDTNRFLSIIDYGESERENAKEGFHTIMINSVRRIRSGESMVPVLNPFEDAEELFENHGYLAPYILPIGGNKYKEQSLLTQALATYYSFSGTQDSVSKAEKSFIGFNNETIAVKNLLPATAEILNQTHDKEVVMFNTAHHRPEHAYFVGQLLHRLRDQGFTHLALEALGDSSNVMKRGFATLDDGFYVRDPVMANLINHAIALGFQVIGYESSSVDREQGQAKNLADQTLKLKKGHRLIVLAGYAHIDETMRPKRMAAFFHEITGINPFTIDQTKLMTSVCNDLEVDNRQDVYIYTNKDSTTGTDLQLWNNINMPDKPVGFKRNQIPIETNIGLPDSLRVTDSLIAISVFNQVDYLKNQNAIPIYVTVLRSKGKDHKICLYPGKYLIQYSGKNKELTYSKELIIPD